MAYTLYTDGSAIPNPGPCGCGAVMLDADDNIVWTLSEYLGPSGTNNTGELTAILRGCVRAEEMGITNIIIYSDSELSVMLVNGTKKTKKEHLSCILERINATNIRPNIQINWIKAHNNHKWNEYADQLANNAVANINDPIPVKVPFTAAVTASASFKEVDESNSEKLFLKCPFSDKDEAKKLGARWDAKSKSWWVANTVENCETFAKWLPTK